MMIKGYRKSGLRSFLVETRGVAALEFAIILPVMLLFYVGIIDVTRAVIASRKLDLLSRTISDLVSQQPSSLSVSISKLSTILGAASAVMQPYSTTSLKITISAVDIKLKSDGSKTCCDVLVRWSYTQTGSTSSLRACTSALTQVPDGTKASLKTFPQSLVTANSAQGFAYSSGAVSYVIITDAAFTYTPIFSQAISWFGGGMSKTTYMVPRSPSNPVTIADPSTATAPQLGKICFS